MKLIDLLISWQPWTAVTDGTQGYLDTHFENPWHIRPMSVCVAVCMCVYVEGISAFL